MVFGRRGRTGQSRVGWAEAQVVTGQILLEKGLEREGWDTSAGQDLCGLSGQER